MEFKRGRQSLGDGTRPRRPVAVAAPETAMEVHDIVMADMIVTERYIASSWDFTEQNRTEVY